MGEFLDFFKNKKNLVSILILGILILALPLGRDLIRRQQIIKSRATEDPIVFVADDNVSQKDGKWIAKKPQVSLRITSPLGPAGIAVPTTAPAPSTSPVTFPTASFNISQGSLEVGQQVNINASAVSSNGNNITSVEFYFSPPETLIGSCTTSSCSKTWTPTTAGAFKVYMDVHDSGGRKCSNNPNHGYTTTDPNGWANCGSSAVTVTVR